MDILTQLGELAFASRLRRLGERLQKEVSHLYKKLGIDFEARWFAILITLSHDAPITVTALAKKVHLTHTAINQIAAEMMAKGYLTWSPAQDDGRKRLLVLTPAGLQVLQQLLPIWEEVRAATSEVLAATGCDVITALNDIERQLDQHDMYERVWLRLKGHLPAEIEIIEYRPALKKYFQSLNYEWLQARFTVEPLDVRLLSDPKGRIINQGGVILFAVMDDMVVGTCALIKHRRGLVELAKMAVTRKFQSRGIGRILLQAAIDRAQSMQVRELYLRTNPELEAANHLYHAMGFEKIDQDPFPGKRYDRPTLTMKRRIRA